jgi:tetratricopeptide (TPR) repeat protein
MNLIQSPEKLFSVIALTFLVLLTYANSLQNEFLSDDIPSIVQNENIKTFSFVIANPLAAVQPFIYFLIYRIAGPNPAAFRLVNILFHVGTVWLIYLIISRLINSKVAFISAAIFAVHPILTESVTWISGGPYSWYSFFFLLSFLTYIRSHNLNSYIISLAFFIISMSLNPKAISLPFIFFLYEIALAKDKNWAKTLPFFFVSGIWGLHLVGLVGQRLSSVQAFFPQASGIYNPAVQIPIAITSYLKLIFWPKDLTLYHSELSVTRFEYALQIIVFLLFLGLVLYSFRHNRLVFFWLSFFFISLLPTLTPLRLGWVVAERYVYLGSIGIFVVISLVLYKLSKLHHVKIASYIIFGLIITALCARTVNRNIDWRSEDNLWIATAKTSPSDPQTHNNMGDVYGRHGDLSSAAREFEIAIQLNPNYAAAYHNLGNTLRDMGERGKAIENYQKAVSFDPNLWQSYQNLAAIYWGQNKLDLTRDNLQKAIAINHHSSDLYANLGVIYLVQDNKDDAKKAFLEALNIDPENPRAKAGLEKTIAPN